MGRSRRIIATVAAVAAFVGGATVAHAPAEAVVTAPAPVLVEAGDLRATVEDLAATMPGRDSGGYDVPTSSERSAMAAAWDAVEAGDLGRAASLVNPLAYDVVRYTDTVTGRTSVVLRERRNADGSWPHAWGLYVRTSGSRSRLVVEAPHPKADVNSESMALDAFRSRNAVALMVAGAHRDANPDGSADVAHRTDSVFEVVHRAALTPSSRVYSAHGFADATLPGIEAVVSRGASPSGATVKVSDAVAAAGFARCLYDGTRCKDLAGTTNVQGQSTRSAGADFVHVEVNRTVRDDPARRRRLAETVAAASFA